MSEGTAPEVPPPGRRSKRRRVILLGLAVLLVGGGAALAGVWKVSASPQFCNSCHIMEAYVDAWKASKHSPVACVQCHYPPGFRDTLWVKYQAISQVAKWATKTYTSKPYAEVEDASCLRSECHSRAGLDGQGVVTSSRGMRFDHRPHLDPARAGSQLRCVTCHAQVVVERHFEVNRSACFLCHFKGTRSGRELTPIAGCTACHQTPKGEIAIGSIRFNHEEVVRREVGCPKCHLSVVEGDGAAPAVRCLGCHNQPEKVRRYADTRLVHEVHVTRHPIECLRCHDEIRHRLPPAVRLPASAERAPSVAVAARPTP